MILTPFGVKSSRLFNVSSIGCEAAGAASRDEIVIGNICSLQVETNIECGRSILRS